MSGTAMPYILGYLVDEETIILVQVLRYNA